VKPGIHQKSAAEHGANRLAFLAIHWHRFLLRVVEDTALTADIKEKPQKFLQEILGLLVVGALL